MKIFHLPDLGEGLPDAEIREWYVKEGDEVKVDQPMVAMETAKAVVDVPAPRSGRIVKLHGKAGDVINTGAPLVEFADGEEIIKKEKSATVVGNLETSNTILQESPMGIIPTTAAGTIKAIPAVRALAKRLNVDLAKIKPTGVGGQITLEDVEKAHKTPSPLAGEGWREGEIDPIRGVRRAMALAMAHSHSEVVPITLVDDADIHAWPEKTDITLRVIRALTVGCEAEPSLNAWFDSKAMARKLHKEVHIGIAIDSAEGLFVPVLKNAHIKSDEELRADINRFKDQVKNRTIPQDDLKGATLVLSNVGIFAGRYANPIVIPPMVAILATGRIREEAVAHTGKVEIHKIMPLSLTIDHRAITGGEAARFLAAVITDLQK